MKILPASIRSEERLWFLRRPFQLMVDIAVLGVSFFLAYLLRFEFQLEEYYFDNALNQLPFVVFVQFASLFVVGAYSIIWRYVSLEDIKAFLKAALISGVILILIRLLVSNCFRAGSCGYTRRAARLFSRTRRRNYGKSFR